MKKFVDLIDSDWVLLEKHVCHLRCVTGAWKIGDLLLFQTVGRPIEGILKGKRFTLEHENDQGQVDISQVAVVRGTFSWGENQATAHADLWIEYRDLPVGEGSQIHLDLELRSFWSCRCTDR